MNNLNYNLTYVNRFSEKKSNKFLTSKKIKKRRQSRQKDKYFIKEFCRNIKINTGKCLIGEDKYFFHNLETVNVNYLNKYVESFCNYVKRDRKKLSSMIATIKNRLNKDEWYALTVDFASRNTSQSKIDCIKKHIKSSKCKGRGFYSIKYRRELMRLMQDCRWLRVKKGQFVFDGMDPRTLISRCLNFFTSSYDAWSSILTGQPAFLQKTYKGLTEKTKFIISQLIANGIQKLGFFKELCISTCITLLKTCQQCKTKAVASIAFQLRKIDYWASPFQQFYSEKKRILSLFQIFIQPRGSPLL